MTQSGLTAEEINHMMRGYQASCVVMAGAELEVFDLLAGAPLTSAEVCARLGTDARATEILLDALAALRLLGKEEGRFSVPDGVAAVLTRSGKGSHLAMVQHQANCMRNWAHLAAVAKSGRPADAPPSIRGEAADYESFIEAMDNVSGPVAGKLLAELQPLAFSHLLDVGGGSGTWTLAFLKAAPGAKATIFDLPHVVPQARARVAGAGMADRVTLAAGSFYTDELPRGADLAWVSAIVHQNSREQNRELFARVHRALVSGGRILIRDIVMDASRTTPVAGALFAVNMLVNTPRGGTFTLEELAEDLAHAGFVQTKLLRRDEGMHSVVTATRP